MEWGMLEGLLRLLFGQLGVLGTALVAFSAVLMWLLLREQEEHAQTRKASAEINEKRLELAVQTLKALHEFKSSIDALAAKGKNNARR
jgi:hypothetical protein